MAEKNLERKVVHNLEREGLVVYHYSFSNEKGPFDWPTFVQHIRTKATYLNEKVFNVELGGVREINVYRPGKWEEIYESIFSSEESIKKAKSDYEDYIYGVNWNKQHKEIEEKERKDEIEKECLLKHISKMIGPSAKTKKEDSPTRTNWNKILT